ncbi:MAG: glutamate racemase [Gemmatimonadaceae bacterium]
MSSQRPVGVFDSGIGGLTVVHEIMRQLPHESIVYFGDTARVPYGPKSPETVRRYSREISAFLRDQSVKAIVVACNTATAHALPMLRAEMTVPVIGVVEPGARAAVRQSAGGHIGVIGTEGTIRSGAYKDAIRVLRPDVRVTARACPLFVPLVEEGWVDHAVTRQVALEYLQPLIDERISALVLGCTHYPLLKPLLCQVLGSGVALIDSAAETAAELGRVLSEAGLEAPPGVTPSRRFISSDDPLQFLELGQRFLGDAIERVEVHTFV